MKAKINCQKGFGLVELLLLIIIVMIAGFGGYYIWSQNRPVEITADESQSVLPEPKQDSADRRYNSKLYPGLSFETPEGWSVDEPEDYSKGAFEGSADGVITVSNGGVKLNLRLKTILATGFEGYTCYKYDDIKQTGRAYRFTDKEDQIIYQNGVTESDSGWQEAIEGEFTQKEDSQPNYCTIFPFIGTYESKLVQADYPKTPYGHANNKQVMVWLSADLTGSPNADQLEDADKVIETLSESAVVER